MLLKTVLGDDRNCSDVMIGKGGVVARGLESRPLIYYEKDQSDVECLSYGKRFVVSERKRPCFHWTWYGITSR